MSAVVEARSILCAVPVDTARGESRGVWLQRCAAFFGLSNSEASKIYYRRKERMDADKLAFMREQLEQLEERTAQRRGTLDELQERLAAIRSSQGGRDRGGDSAPHASTGGRSDAGGDSGLRAGERPSVAGKAD